MIEFELRKKVSSWVITRIHSLYYISNTFPVLHFFFDQRKKRTILGNMHGNYRPTKETESVYIYIYILFADVNSSKYRNDILDRNGYAKAGFGQWTCLADCHRNFVSPKTKIKKGLFL